MNTALTTIKKMTVKSDSVIVNETFVVVKTGRNSYRLGEMMGDWLMSGTAEQVIARAFGK